MVNFNSILACPVGQTELFALNSNRPECQLIRERSESATSQEELFSVLDLTPKGSASDAYQSSRNKRPLRMRLFQNAAIAYAYERVLPALWATGLRKSGIEREGDRVLDWFADVGDGKQGVVVDLSCGTGIVARRLVRDSPFHIIAMDYSLEMLKELQARCREQSLDSTRIAIVRADVSRLPLVPDSVDAIYSGAAMHCWPDAEAGMSQIYSALKPGGKLYLTTFLKPLPSFVFRFFSLDEIARIAKEAGFTGELKLEGSGIYATLMTSKPMAND